MPDTHSKETRSYNMSRIRSRNTKPEVTDGKEVPFFQRTEVQKK
jgi:G:T-mismatch repair DNA endonuclease (very short patch repair protein)